MSAPLYAGPGTRYTGNYFPGTGEYKSAAAAAAIAQNATQTLVLATVDSEPFPLQFKKVINTVSIKKDGMYALTSVLQLQGADAKDITPDAYISILRGATEITGAQQWVRMLSGVAGAVWGGALTLSYTGFLLAGDIISVKVINKSKAADETIVVLAGSTLKVSALA